MFVTHTGKYALCCFLQIKLDPSISVQLKKNQALLFRKLRLRKAMPEKEGRKIWRTSLSGLILSS